jgi:hypothetical protein
MILAFFVIIGFLFSFLLIAHCLTQIGEMRERLMIVEISNEAIHTAHNNLKKVVWYKDETVPDEVR